MSIVPAAQTINKILLTKDLSIVKHNGLEVSDFIGFEEQFNFIIEHNQKYGNVPDETTFYEKFPNWVLTEVNETDDYLLDRLHDECRYRKFAEVIPKVAKYAQDSPRDAYDYLNSQMNELKPHTICRGNDIMANAQERYDAYINKAKDPEKAVISTGFQELDAIFNGWEMGDELVTIVARTNEGKSWILLKFLAEAWKQGKRVGLYSGEMNHIKLGYRFDALFQHFSNWSLVRGTQVVGYKEYIDSLKESKNPFIIVQQKDFGGRPTVEKIRGFIEANNVDIMGIDQYSLMSDGRAKNNDQARTRLAHISEDLFLLSSEYKIPIIGLAQANREGINKDDQMKAPGLENIKESDDISHNSSKCIGIRQSNMGLILDIIKNREGKVGDKLIYSWDIDTGNFSWIPGAGDAAPAPIRQQTVTQTKQQFASPTSINPF